VYIRANQKLSVLKDNEKTSFKTFFQKILHIKIARTKINGN